MTMPSPLPPRWESRARCQHGGFRTELHVSACHAPPARARGNVLVVDYLGLAHELKRALATYTESGGKGQTAVDTGQAVRVMLEEVGGLLRPVPRLRPVRLGERLAGRPAPVAAGGPWSTFWHRRTARRVA